MGVEIERKFLVKKGAEFVSSSTSRLNICQGYLADNPDRVVRIRIIGEKAYLTIKSRNRGSFRYEWEYEIPFEDAKEMLGLPGVRTIVKTRYIIPVNGLKWELDVFHEQLDGLILAEVELDDTDKEIDLPWFIDREVTDDSRYYNSNLIIADRLPD